MPSAAVQNRQPICPYTASGRANRRIAPHAKRDSTAGRGTHTICYIIGRSELFYGSPRSFGGNAKDQVRKRAKSPLPPTPRDTSYISSRCRRDTDRSAPSSAPSPPPPACSCLLARCSPAALWDRAYHLHFSQSQVVGAR